MSKTQSTDRQSRRQQRLGEVFESVCGTTVIHEQQEEQRHRPDDEQVETPVTIETYLDQNLRSDGLDDAIDSPDMDTGVGHF